MPPGRRSRGLFFISAALLAAGLTASAALGVADSQAAPPTLAASSTSVTSGSSVTLAARASLQKGDHLLITARHGSQVRNVKECKSSPCVGTWRETGTGSVTFQALVILRSGKTFAIFFRSRVVVVTWKASTPPPPPTPKAAAVPGHYEGKTGDNEIFRFDITSDGRGITHLQTGQINETCTPPGSLSGGNIGPLSSTYTVALDGSFTISGTLQTTVGTAPATDTITITGNVLNSSGSGLIRDDTAFVSNGFQYKCTSGNQTWSATRVS
jgi:hypothetical protein